MLPTRDTVMEKDTHRLKVRGGKKIFHPNRNNKKQGSQYSYRQNILHIKNAEYTFFSSAHERLSRTDHILGHKQA